MWSPTHVEVTVSRAKNLKTKGKSGTNDAYVTIKFGKEKFQTTLRERVKDPEWHEQCQFALSEENSLVKLKVFNRNLIGKDDFLGYVEIPLDPSLVYERPKSRWYNLGNRPEDKGPEKYRGEIEIFLTYVVQSIAGSQMSLNMPDQSKKRFLPKGLTKPFDKLHGKSSLKRIPGHISESSFDLSSTDSGYGQSSSTLPPLVRKPSKDSTVSGSLDEEIDPESDHQTLKDQKQSHLKSSVFKFPFRTKNKRLQKMSLLSQSTLGLSSVKPHGAKFGPMQEVPVNPPSESSSGIGSRRVSTSESRSSAGEDFVQKEVDSSVAGSHNAPPASESSALLPPVEEVHHRLPRLIEIRHLPENEENVEPLSVQSEDFGDRSVSSNTISDNTLAMEFDFLDSEVIMESDPNVEKQQTVAIENLNMLLYGGSEDQADVFGLSSNSSILKEDEEEENSSSKLGDIDELIFGRRRSDSKAVADAETATSSLKNDFMNVFDDEDNGPFAASSSLDTSVKLNVDTDVTESIWAELSAAERKMSKDSFEVTNSGSLNAKGGVAVNNLPWDMSFSVDNTSDHDQEDEWTAKADATVDGWGSVKPLLGEEVFGSAHDTVMSPLQFDMFHEQNASVDKVSDAFQVNKVNSENLFDQTNEQPTEASMNILDSAFPVAGKPTGVEEFQDNSFFGFSNFDSDDRSSPSHVGSTDPEFGLKNSTLQGNLLDRLTENSTEVGFGSSYDDSFSSDRVHGGESFLPEGAFSTGDTNKDIFGIKEVTETVDVSNDLTDERLSEDTFGLQRSSGDILSLMMDPIGDPVPTSTSFESEENMFEPSFVIESVQEKLFTDETKVDSSDIFGDTSSWAVPFSDDAANTVSQVESLPQTLLETTFENVSDFVDKSQQPLFEVKSDKLTDIPKSPGRNDVMSLITNRSGNFTGDDDREDLSGIQIGLVQPSIPDVPSKTQSVGFDEDDVSWNFSLVAAKKETEVTAVDNVLTKADSYDKQNLSFNIFDDELDPSLGKQSEEGMLQANDLLNSEILIEPRAGPIIPSLPTDIFGNQSNDFQNNYIQSGLPEMEFGLSTEVDSFGGMPTENILSFHGDQTEAVHPSENEVKLLDDNPEFSFDEFNSKPKEKMLQSDDESSLELDLNKVENVSRNQALSLVIGHQEIPVDVYDLGDRSGNAENTAENPEAETNFKDELLEFERQSNDNDFGDDELIESAFVADEGFSDFGDRNIIKDDQSDLGKVWSDSKMHHDNFSSTFTNDIGFDKHMADAEPTTSLFGDDFLSDSSIKMLQNDVAIKEQIEKQDEQIMNLPDLVLNENSTQLISSEAKMLYEDHSEDLNASINVSTVVNADLTETLLIDDSDEVELNGNAQTIDFEPKADDLFVSSENADTPAVPSSNEKFPSDEPKLDEILNFEKTSTDDHQNPAAFDNGTGYNESILDEVPSSDGFSGYNNFEIVVTKTLSADDSNYNSEDETLSVVAVNSDFKSDEISVTMKSSNALAEVVHPSENEVKLLDDNPEFSFDVFNSKPKETMLQSDDESSLTLDLDKAENVSPEQALPLVIGHQEKPEVSENLVEHSLPVYSGDQFLEESFNDDRNIFENSRFDLASIDKVSVDLFTEKPDFNIQDDFSQLNNVQDDLFKNISMAEEEQHDFSPSESRTYASGENKNFSDDAISKIPGDNLSSFENIPNNDDILKIVSEKLMSEKIHDFEESESNFPVYDSDNSIEHSNLFDTGRHVSFEREVDNKDAAAPENVEFLTDHISDDSHNFFDNFSEDFDKTAVFSAMQGSAQRDIFSGASKELGSDVAESWQDGKINIPSSPVHEVKAGSLVAAAVDAEDGREQRLDSLPDSRQIFLPTFEEKIFPETLVAEAGKNDFCHDKSEESLAATITNEDADKTSLELRFVDGDMVSGLNASGNLAESIEPKSNLSSSTPQSVPSDLLENSNETPLHLESQHAASTIAPLVSKSEFDSFSESFDLDLNTPAFNFDSAKLVLQSVGTNSNSSDLKLESPAQESVSKDQRTKSEILSSEHPAAPVSESPVFNSEAAFADVKLSIGQSLSKNQGYDIINKNGELINNVASAASSSSRPIEMQPEAENKRVILDVGKEKESSEASLPLTKNLSVDKDEAVIPSGPTLLLPEDVLKEFRHHSRDELIQIVLDQRRLLREKDAHIQDLEGYIDNLLVKVIDIQPRLLMADETHSSGKTKPSSSKGLHSLFSKTKKA